MPEHYEVKRIAQYLKKNGLCNQRLKKSVFLNKGERIVKPTYSEKLFSKLVNTRLTDIKVKAKYTGFEFELATLVLHYRFTGIPHLEHKPYEDLLYSIFSLPIVNTNQNHCRFTWNFEQDTMHYIDTRCLSTLYVYPNLPFEKTTHYTELAPDLSHYEPLTASLFKQTYNRRKITLKQWLLDQKAAPSGIGNYLACEILAAAKLYPFTPVNTLTTAQYTALVAGIEHVKNNAEKSPRYDWFNVFNKKTCKSCKSVIKTVKIPAASQTTHYCPTCQANK